MSSRAGAWSSSSAPVGVASSIWPHGRWRFDFDGRGQPCRARPGWPTGATRCWPTPRAVLPAREAAERHDALATFGKVRVEPNGVNAIPSRVTAWLDARARRRRERVRAVLQDLGGAGAARERGVLDRRDAVRPPAARPSGRPARRAGRPGTLRCSRRGPGMMRGSCPWPMVETAMLFVRNPTGISHSPEEYAEESDCVAGVEALARVVRDLAS